jgi:hypothetical protein
MQQETQERQNDELGSPHLLDFGEGVSDAGLPSFKNLEAVRYDEPAPFIEEGVKNKFNDFGDMYENLASIWGTNPAESYNIESFLNLGERKLSDSLGTPDVPFEVAAFETLFDEVQIKREDEEENTESRLKKPTN